MHPMISKLAAGGLTIATCATVLALGDYWSIHGAQGQTQSIQEAIRKRVAEAKKAADSISPPASEEHLRAFIYAFKGGVTADQVRNIAAKDIAAVQLPPEFLKPDVLAAIALSLNDEPKVWQPDRPADDGEYLETVKLVGYQVLANGSTIPTGYCTGTLISPSAILTAAHCACDLGKTVKVFVGNTPPNVHQSVIVSQAVHGLDCERFQAANDSIQQTMLRSAGDIAVMKAAEDLTAFGAMPARLGLPVVRGHSYYIVGYGTTNSPNPAPKWVGTIASLGCDAQAAVNYGCNPDDEFYGIGKLLSTGLATDTCNGDSGGPVFVAENSLPAKLVAVTSRPVLGTPQSSPCGHGGLYVRIDGALLDWVVANSK